MKVCYFNITNDRLVMVSGYAAITERKEWGFILPFSVWDELKFIVMTRVQTNGKDN